jgi:hypothetical protein
MGELVDWLSSTGLTQLAQGEEDFFHHLALDK